MKGILTIGNRFSSEAPAQKSVIIAYRDNPSQR